jgi:hypothetical protein
MAGDRKEHVAHVAIEGVAEKSPTDVEKPGRQGRQEGVETGQQKVVRPAALPFEDVLKNSNDQPSRNRYQHCRQSRARAGGLGRHEHPARRHGFPTSIRLAMGTSKV